jgi:hypothetical protein
MLISPNINGQCLSISFATTWLRQNVLETNEDFENLKQDISTIESFSLLGKMKPSERKIVQELYEISWKKSFGNFFIKCTVLKIISDFLYRIKERETFTINNFCLKASLKGVEKYLNKHSDFDAV